MTEPAAETPAPPSAETQTPLFRLEAVLAANRTFSEERLRLVPLRWQTIVGTVALVLGACAALGLQVETTRRVVVPGVLRPADGEVEVRIPRAGVIESLQVAEGQSVRPGELLARIGSGVGWLEGRRVAQRVTASLARREAQLRAQRGALVRAGEVTRRAAEGRRIELSAQLAQADRLVEVQRQRLVSTKGRFSRVGPLSARGFLSAYAYEELRDGVLAREQALVEGTLARQRLVEEVRSQRELAHRQAEELKVELAELDGRLASLDLERARERALWSYELVAPRGGTVSGLVDEQGDSVLPGQVLATLISDGAVLAARLRVPARGVARVTAGLPVALRIGAYPYQKFGTVPGAVRSVSKTTIAPEEPGVEPAYMVQVELERQAIETRGAEWPLRAGMDVTAELITDRAAVWRRLVDAVTALR